MVNGISPKQGLMPCGWQGCKDEMSSLLLTIDSIKKKEKRREKPNSININIPNLKLDDLPGKQSSFLTMD